MEGNVETSERRHLIDMMYKTVIDNIVPDYIKILLQRSDESLQFKPNAEKVKEIQKKIQSCSKYQLAELMDKYNFGQWEEMMIRLQMTEEQRKIIVKGMKAASHCKANFTRIINDLLRTRKDLFEELDKATQVVDVMRDSLTIE